MKLKNKKTYENGRIIILKGDITQLQADCIVNAANSSLMGGGGVDGAIHRAAGSGLLEECRAIRKDKYPKGLPTGQAVSTKAYNLPALYVIHTVGPIWNGKSKEMSSLLSGCYRNSLQTALELNADSIAFPAISTGVYGYPKPEAAAVAYESIKEFIITNNKPQTIYLVFFSEYDCITFINTIG